MRMHSVLLLSLVLLLGPTQAIRGQSFYDDSSMRRDAAQRISDEHGLVFDWRKYSLSQLTDAELRLDAVKRIGQEHGLRFDWQKSTLSSLTDAELRLDAVKCIKQEHGVQFDWQKSSLSSLIDAELRMDAAKRISSATGKNLDWRTYSLTQLTQFELRLSQAGQQKLPSFARSVTVPLTRIEPGATYSSDTREDVRSAADDLSWEIRKLRRNASDYNPDEYERKLTRLELDLEDLSSRVAPHNSPAYKTDLTKPWNSLCGNNDDLTTKERNAYGLPKKASGLGSFGIDEDDK